MEAKRRLTPEPEYVNVEPVWENVAKWAAHALSQNTFDVPCYGAVAAFAEIIAYLEHKNPEFVTQLIAEFRGKESGNATR